MKNREEAEKEIKAAEESLSKAITLLQGDYKGNQANTSRHILWDCRSLLLTVRQLLLEHVPIEERMMTFKRSAVPVVSVSDETKKEGMSV